MHRLTCLGALEIAPDEQALPAAMLVQTKHLALIAYLALSVPAPVRRDRIAALLWPELDETRARNAISKALHAIRRTFGEDAIVGRFSAEIALDASKWSCDLWEFRTAVASGDYSIAWTLAARGPLLDGFHVGDSAPFEQWLDGEREQSRRLVVEAALAASTEGMLHSEWASAERALHVASRHAPFDERIVQQHVRLLDASGNRAESLRRFVAFEELLQAELGATPSPETLAVVATVRAREYAVLPPTQTPEPPDRAETPQHNALHTTVPARSDEAETDERVDSTPTAAEKRRRGGWRQLVITGAFVAAAVSLFNMRRSIGAAEDVALPMANGLGATPIEIAEEANAPEQATPEPAALLPADSPAADTVRAAMGTPDRRASRSAMVVTAFANQTGDSTLTAWGNLAADFISEALGRAGVAIVVDARTRQLNGLMYGADSLAMDAESLSERARALGATRVITGAFYLADGGIVFTANVRALPGGRALRFADERSPRRDPSLALRRVTDRLLGIVASLGDARLVSSATASTHMPTYDAYQAYIRGLALFENDMRGAVPMFLKALHEDSLFVSMVPMLTESLAKMGQGARADSLARAVHDRMPLLMPFDKAQVTYWNAFRRGDRPAMYEASREMVTQAPLSGDAQWHRGFAAIGVQRFREAATAFALARARNSWMEQKLFTAVRWPSMALHLLGEHGEEIALTRRARQRFPYDVQACVPELMALAPTRPLEELEQALRNCPSSTGVPDSQFVVAVRPLIAQELRAHRRIQDARVFLRPSMAVYRTRLQQSPKLEGTRFDLANALMLNEEWGEALTIYETLLAETSKPSMSLLANVGQCAARVGNLTRAMEMLDRIPVSKSGPPFYRLYRARILAHAGRASEAVSELRDALANGLMAAEVVHGQLGFEPLVDDPEYRALVGSKG